MMQSGAESSDKQQNGGSNHVFEANRSLISELNQENLRSKKKYECKKVALKDVNKTKQKKIKTYTGA